MCARERECQIKPDIKLERDREREREKEGEREEGRERLSVGVSDQAKYP